MSKFINLSEDIAIATENTRSPYAWDAQREALEWLDSHPDQVPGRTITESELDKVAEGVIEDTRPMTLKGLIVTAGHRLGITVVPDPEATNAEKWETFCKQLHVDLTPWQIDYLAAAMDEKGVKAPDHD